MRPFEWCEECTTPATMTGIPRHSPGCSKGEDVKSKSFFFIVQCVIRHWDSGHDMHLFVEIGQDGALWLDEPFEFNWMEDSYDKMIDPKWKKYHLDARMYDWVKRNKTEEWGDWIKATFPKYEIVEWKVTKGEKVHTKLFTVSFA